MFSTLTKILLTLTVVSGTATIVSVIDDMCINNEYADEREQYLRDNDPNYNTAVIYE